MKPILFFIALLFASGISAQNPDSAEYKYNRENIVRLGNGFVKGGIKLSFDDLRNEFNRSPIGLDLYQAARRHRTNARIFSAASLASVIAMFSFAVTANRTGDRTGMYISLGSQFFFILLSRQQRRNANLMTDRALIERNRQVLFH